MSSHRRLCAASGILLALGGCSLGQPQFPGPPQSISEVAETSAGPDAVPQALGHRAHGDGTYTDREYLADDYVALSVEVDRLRARLAACEEGSAENLSETGLTGVEARAVSSVP